MEDQNNKDSWIRQGKANFEKEDYDQAVSDFTEAISLDQEDAYAWYMRGKARTEGMFSSGLGVVAFFGSQAAFDDLNMAIGLDPEFTEPLIFRAYFLARRDFHQEAIPEFIRAIEIEQGRDGIPNDAILSLAYQRLGDSYQALGNVERARAAYALANGHTN